MVFVKFIIYSAEQLEELKAMIAAGVTGGLLFCWDNVPKYLIIHDDYTVSEVSEYRYNWTFDEYREVTYDDFVELIGVRVG